MHWSMIIHQCLSSVLRIIYLTPLWIFCIAKARTKVAAKDLSLFMNVAFENLNPRNFTPYILKNKIIL